jgi:hypothetical protein
MQIAWKIARERVQELPGAEEPPTATATASRRSLARS